jgi:hypothetical protein
VVFESNSSGIFFFPDPVNSRIFLIIASPMPLIEKILPGKSVCSSTLVVQFCKQQWNKFLIYNYSPREFKLASKATKKLAIHFLKCKKKINFIFLNSNQNHSESLYHAELC